MIILVIETGSRTGLFREVGKFEVYLFDVLVYADFLSFHVHYVTEIKVEVIDSVPMSKNLR